MPLKDSICSQDQYLKFQKKIIHNTMEIQTPPSTPMRRFRNALDRSKNGLNKSRSGIMGALNISRNGTLDRSRSGMDGSRNGLNVSRNGMDKSRSGMDRSRTGLTQEEEGTYCRFVSVPVNQVKVMTKKQFFDRTKI